MASVSGSSERPTVRRTLRGRVSLLGLGVIAIWVILITVAFNVVLARRLSSQADAILRTRATTAAATVAVSARGVVAVRETSGDAELDSGIWVYDAGGVAVERPSGGARLQHFTRTLAGTGPGYSSRYDNRFYALPVLRQGRPVATVVASVSSDPYTRAQAEALLGSALVALLVLAGAYPVLRFAAGRALRPVDAMTTRAGEWSAHAVNERFGPNQPYQEVQALAATLDGVLDRLAAIVRHEQHLSAELSHELRTPLSRIVAETDLLLARPHTRDELDVAHSAVRESAMAMEGILETLLSAARVQIQSAPGRCQVDEVLARIAAARERQRDGSAVELVVEVERGLSVGVEDVVVERILSPLLENAGRYARSTITVVASRSSDSIVIDVLDDGPGVPAELREAIFEPGRRGHPDDGHDGAGLGLALTRRLARAAAGDVSVVAADSRFRVRLPPA